jgi:6-phosphogluconolactonase
MGMTQMFQNNISDHIKKIMVKLHADNESRLTIMLTGGRSAEALYKIWEKNSFLDHSKVVYYFGDERCVLPDHPDSNYAMAVSALFPRGIPKNCEIKRMRGETADRNIEAERYSQLLPDSVDLVILSVGPDGHIASLFPDSSALKEMEKAIVPVISPKLPAKRLTISPKIIISAKNTVVMAAGKEKGRVLARALEDPDNINELPVRLTIGSTWLLDEAAAQSFKDSNQHNHHNTRIIYA